MSENLSDTGQRRLCCTNGSAKSCSLNLFLAALTSVCSVDVARGQTFKNATGNTTVAHHANLAVKRMLMNAISSGNHRLLRRVCASQVAVPSQRSWHPLPCPSLTTRCKRRPAQRWACSSKPDGSEENPQPKNHREKALKQFTEQLASRQTKPKLSLRETVAKQWKAVIGKVPL